nr:PREDICTED: cadherin-19 isoform X2 [Anolis carolinensis]|eukprot:XP_016848399.1 PREDICTED: cadherin-19 isoform X2 [Anolis carolinensis]
MHCGKWLSLALTVAQFSPCFLCKPRCDSEDMEHIFVRSRSMKLSGILKMPFVHEERILTQPLISGQTKSDVQKQDSSLADNWPQFLDGPYEATVPEMSAEGTSVIQVTARGPDSMGARLFYSIPPEQPYFSVEPTTGIIRTLYPVDRETQDQYFVLIQARVGQASERSATTTVTINISDVNDNPPRFQHKRYDMYVSETAPIGSMLGKIMADDNDIGDNAAMEYIIEEEPPHIVYIITDNKTQEGAVILNKTVDYETQSVYDIRVKGINRHVDQRFLSEDMRFEDTAILRIRVQDVDEPPVFISKELLMEISEEEMNNSFVGAVSARDPDKANSPIRYSIVLSEYFSINAHNGTITVTRPLDREIAAWHNITVTATESMNLKQVSEVNVYIEVLDINEYAPEISEYYEMYVCENARSSQFIQTISAVDRDDPMEGHHFFFYLTEEATNISGFAIEDNHIFVLAIVALKQQTKPPLFHEKGEPFRENIVKYDDEGGGEQDTEAFDISALRTQPVLREHKPRRNITTQIQSLYRQSLQVGPESAIFREFIAQKLEEANSDPDVPPFDSLQIYAFEGIGSVAGSLSTLGSSSPDSDENEYYLLELDTHFKRTGTIHDSIPPKSGVLESAHGHKMEIF